MNKDNLAGFGIGILAGAVIGGAIALLYAPRSGKETREFLRSKTVETADHVRDLATETVGKVKATAAETVGKVKATAAEAGRKGEEVIHAMKS